MIIIFTKQKNAMSQNKTPFPLSLTYPVQKIIELIESLEEDIDNPKAKSVKATQRKMSKKALEIRRLAKAISNIISEQKPYAKKKTPSHEAIVRGTNSKQK